MKLAKTIRLVWTFYRSYAFASALISIASLKILWDSDLRLFGMVFWGKLATLGIIYYLIDNRKREQYYYYQNLGVSKGVLWATTLLFDFSLFLSLITLTYRLR